MRFAVQVGKQQTDTLQSVGWLCQLEQHLTKPPPGHSDTGSWHGLAQAVPATHLHHTHRMIITICLHAGLPLSHATPAHGSPCSSGAATSLPV